MRHFRLHFLLLFLMVLLSSCVQTTVTPVSTLPPTLSPQAHIYLTTALDIMQQHSVNHKKINWTTLRQQTFALANGATTPQDTYLAIESALVALNDHHSTFRTPNEDVNTGSTGELTSNEKPSGHLLAHDIGYLALPTYNKVSTVPASKDYVQLAQDAIRLADQAGTCGWIVDLRNDTGGDSWPMLAAIGPVLGEGVVGGFVDPDGVKTAWSYADGKAQLGGKTVVGIENAYHLKHLTPAVAVLTGHATASAGEMIVVAFRGRPDTRSFGEPTAGVPTANEVYTLSDGALLVLTVALDADRTGHTYDGPIAPDKPIPYDASQVGAQSSSVDSLIQAATTWIHTQEGCQG